MNKVSPVDHIGTVKTRTRNTGAACRLLDFSELHLILLRGCKLEISLLNSMELG